MEKRKARARATQLAYRERLIAEGKCVQCWQPLKRTDPPGRMCWGCRERRRELTRKDPSKPRGRAGRRPIEETVFDMVLECLKTGHPTTLTVRRCRELVADPATRAALVCLPDEVTVAEKLLFPCRAVKLSPRRIKQLSESKAFKAAIRAAARKGRRRR